MRRPAFVIPLLVALALLATALPASARSNIAIGWTVEDNAHDTAAVMAAVDDYVAQVGKKPKIWSLWSRWGARGADSNGPCTDPSDGCSFPTDTVKALHARGIVPMVWWVYVDPKDPFGNRRYGQYKKITNRVHDAYIKSWAIAARDVGRQTGKPTIIRFAHESDGTWFAWSDSLYTNTPAKFKAAWARMWKKFDRVGANKHVRWLWSPIKPQKSRFPGNRYVDYVGVTLLNPGNVGSKRWRSAKAVLDQRMRQVRAVTYKPVIGAEIGTGWKGGNKGTWVKELYTRAYWRYPKVKGLVYLNVKRQPDWRLHIGDNGSGLTEYRKLAKKTKYQGNIR